MPQVTAIYKTAEQNETDLNTLVYKGGDGSDNLTKEIKSLSLSEDTANGNALTFAIAFTSKDKGPMERAKAQLATIGITAEEAQAGGILRARVTSRDVMARAALALATDVAIGKGDAHYGVIDPDVATEIVSQEVARDPQTYSAEKLNLLSLKNNTMSALDTQLRSLERPFSSLEANIPFAFSLVTNINEEADVTVVGGKPAVLVQTEVTTKSGAAEAVVAAAKSAGLKYEVSLESDRAQLRSPKGAILDTSKGDRITIEAPANTVAEALKKSGVLSDFIADPIIARAEQLHPGQQEINQTVKTALRAGVEGQARWNTTAEETKTGAGGITRSGTASRSASGGMQIDPITGEMTRNVTRGTRGARGGSSPFDLSGVSYGVDGSSNGPINSLNRPAQDFTTRTNANAQIQGNTGERKFSNISIIGDNALTIDPAGIVIGNPMILDIARVNPETINEPATRAFFDEQVAGYSSRLLAAVNEEFGYNAHDRQSIFEFGLNTAGIENPAMIDALRQRYDRLTADGDIPAGLEVFKQYGDHLIRNTNQDRVFQSLKQASAQVLENAPADLFAQRTEQLEKALNQLPPDLVEAANRIGTKIIVSDDHDSMQFASRTIHISKDTLASGDEQLKTVLKEEMTHYVDEYLGFTKQPEWRRAVESSTKDVDTNVLNPERVRVRALLDAPGDMQEKLQLVQEALDAQIRTAANYAVGKKGTDTYDARERAAELLPDILNARTVLEQSGESAEYIERSLTGIYGKEAVQMVDTYLAQVKQVADGSHPRIIEEKSNTILKTALANAEVPEAMRRTIVGRIQDKLKTDPNYTGEGNLYTDASGRSVTLGDMVTKATQGIRGGNLTASELTPSGQPAKPTSLMDMEIPFTSGLGHMLSPVMMGMGIANWNDGKVFGSNYIYRGQTGGFTVGTVIDWTKIGADRLTEIGKLDTAAKLMKANKLTEAAKALDGTKYAETIGKALEAKDALKAAELFNTSLKAEAELAPWFSKLGVVSEWSGKAVGPLMLLSAGNDVYEMTQLNSNGARVAEGLQLTGDLALAAAPTAALFVGAEGAVSIGEISNPIGWGILLGDQISGKILRFQHPEWYTDQHGLSKWSRGGISDMIEDFEQLSAIEDGIKKQHAAAALPTQYPSKAQHDIPPTLSQYNNLLPAAYMSFAEGGGYGGTMTRLEIENKQWSASELDAGIRHTLELAIARKNALESNNNKNTLTTALKDYALSVANPYYAVTDGLGRAADIAVNGTTDASVKNAIDGTNLQILQLTNALDELWHRKGVDPKDYDGFGARDEQRLNQIENITTFQASHPHTEYDAWKANHPQEYAKITDDFAKDLADINALRAQSNTRGGTDLTAFYINPANAGKEGDAKYEMNPETHQFVTVGEKISVILGRRASVQIKEMVDNTRKVPGARTAQDIMNENNALADSVKLDDQLRQWMVITTPSQLEDLAKNYTIHDGSPNGRPIDITKDFGIASPTVKDAFALAMQEGRLHTDATGKFLVLAKDKFLGNDGDNLNQVYAAVTESNKKLAALAFSDQEKLLDAKRKEFYQPDANGDSWVNTAMVNHPELKPYLGEINGMICDGTAPKDLGEFEALLGKIKTYNEKMTQHPSVAENMDSVLGHYGLIQQGDVTGSSYEIPLASAQAFLTADELKKIPVNAAYKGGNAPKAIDQQLEELAAFQKDADAAILATKQHKDEDTQKVEAQIKALDGDAAQLAAQIAQDQPKQRELQAAYDKQIEQELAQNTDKDFFQGGPPPDNLVKINDSLSDAQRKIDGLALQKVALQKNLAARDALYAEMDKQAARMQTALGTTDKKQAESKIHSLQSENDDKAMTASLLTLPKGTVVSGAVELDKAQQAYQQNLQSARQFKKVFDARFGYLSDQKKLLAANNDPVFFRELQKLRLEEMKIDASQAEMVVAQNTYLNNFMAAIQNIQKNDKAQAIASLPTEAKTQAPASLNPVAVAKQLGEMAAREVLGKACFDKIDQIAHANEAMANVIAEFTAYTHGDVKNNNPTIKGLTASTGSRAPLAAGNRDVV